MPGTPCIPDLPGWRNAPDHFYGLPDRLIAARLADHGYLTESMYCRICNGEPLEDPEDILEHPDLARAREEMVGGRRQEALIWLERFLGHPWIGALTHG
ncbi:hypothetical protein ACT6QH_02125 [Xanthobacter sp. TB0139]|uniref:hypothetical protein n=1 Tax=Xanthobacter sp. TB0139 TaxID=3459178 RepID=UPI0040398893